MNGMAWALAAPLSALVAPVVAIPLGRSADIQRRAVCALLLLSALAAVSGGTAGMLSSPSQATLPIGLPWLPMHVRLDALAGFFLLVIGLLLGAVSLYSVGYLRQLADQRRAMPLYIFLPLFVTGMQGVVLADDAYTFMVFWELMSVSSYFLVTFDHEQDTNRRAGFLYLLMAHLGGLLILGGFAVLYAAGGSFEFDVMRAAPLTPLWASTAFLLALSGFGMKAGLIP
jgi:hydrogenase-4 component B